MSYPLRRAGVPPRWLVALAALAAGVTTWSPAPPRPPPRRVPRVTRAALDPALVAGRGASVDFVEQEAENAAHQRHGHRPGPHRLHAAGGGVRPHGGPARRRASTSSSRCRARPTRSPCATASRTRPSGGGITAPLDVTVNGGDRRTMTLTSQYAWLYNQYPFTNDPNADLLHPDWWITECALRAGGHHAAAGDHQAVPADALLRRAAPAARPDLPGRRQGPAHRAGRQQRRVDGHRPARLASSSARRTSRLRRGQRAAVRRRPDRPARLRRRVRQGDRLREAARSSRSTSRRAPTR